MAQNLFTKEGGYLMRLMNKTGVASIKGQAVCFSPDFDDAYIAATDAFTVQGFVYESGIADGEYTWVVRDGVADVLLVDGFASQRNAWVRLSPTVPGRVITQNYPGLDYFASSLTYANGDGVTISGTLNETHLNNNVRLVIGGTTGVPSIDAQFSFTGIAELPDSMIANGYFGTNNRAAGVVLQVYDFVALSWSNIDTFPQNEAADRTITYSGFTADMLSAGEMRLRLYGADAGTANDRFYLDQLILRSSADVEHFKEVGHMMRDVAAGTDRLARMNIHFL